MNPFELTAGPFLTLYAGLWLVSGVWAWLVRARIGPPASEMSYGSLSPVEFAWLSGGRDRAADTVMVALGEYDVARIDVPGRRAVFAEQAAELPPWLAPFHSVLPPTVSLYAIVHALRPVLDDVQDRMIALGLLADATEARAAATRSAMPMLMLAGFAVVRIYLGMQRDKPVGFLTVMMFGTFIASLYLAFWYPGRTRSGSQVLSQAIETNQRLMRAPAAGELPLAFALAGRDVLEGTPYAAYSKWRRRESSGGGDGGSDGGGGGGGSGCGGCSS